MKTSFFKRHAGAAHKAKDNHFDNDFILQLECDGHPSKVQLTSPWSITERFNVSLMQLSNSSLLKFIADIVALEVMVNIVLVW